MVNRSVSIILKHLVYLKTGLAFTAFPIYRDQLIQPPGNIPPEHRVIFSFRFTGRLLLCSYFLEDGYTEAGDRTIFSVGTDLADVQVDKPEYSQGQPITVAFQNGPGTARLDWNIAAKCSSRHSPLVERKLLSTCNRVH